MLTAVQTSSAAKFVSKTEGIALLELLLFSLITSQQQQISTDTSETSMITSALLSTTQTRYEFKLSASDEEYSVRSLVPLHRSAHQLHRLLLWLRQVQSLSAQKRWTAVSSDDLSSSEDQSWNRLALDWPDVRTGAALASMLLLWLLLFSYVSAALFFSVSFERVLFQRASCASTSRTEESETPGYRVSLGSIFQNESKIRAAERYC